MDRIVDPDSTTRHVPRSESVPSKSLETHYKVRLLVYSASDNTWEPRIISDLDVPEVVREYESSKRPVIAADALGYTHDLASRDTRELATDDDLPSDSEIYNEAREHLDTMKVDNDCVTDPDGRTSIGRDCVSDHDSRTLIGSDCFSVSVGKQGALSCDAASILGALSDFSDSGRSMFECAGAFLKITLSRLIPTKLTVVAPRNTMSIFLEHKRSSCETRHESDDTHANVNRQ